MTIDEAKELVTFCKLAGVQQFRFGELAVNYSPMAVLDAEKANEKEETIEEKNRRLEREEAERLDVLLHSAG